MIVDLKRIFANENSSLPIEYSLDMSTVGFGGGYPLKKPVEISGAVTGRSGLTELDAVISYEYDGPCDRCGINTVKKHTLHICKSLAPSIEGEESDSILIVPDMKLDLDEFVYSEVVADVPMKHLCREDCKGICQKCGKNLNSGKCGCPEKEIDPRLSALADLLK